MNICRTCLKTPANKDILQLEKAINVDTNNYVDIMLFCLDITVAEDSKITMNLCSNCYKKIISFYNFKTLSLKNDVYLKSLQPGVTLEDTNISLYVDENGIKHENSLDPDEFGPRIVEGGYIDVKEELDVIYEATEDRESDKELLSLEQENKFEQIKDEIKETGKELSYDQQYHDMLNHYDHLILAPEPKKRKSSKKIKTSKVAKVKNKRQICEECGKSVLNLKEHLAVHQPTSERHMFQCPACPKLFATSRGRKKHHNTKHLGIKFECDICHKKVVCLSVHKLRTHNPAALRFVCVLCDRRYLSQFELDLHMTSHTKHHAFECDVCQKKFRTKTRITHHIKEVHDKVKRYQCHLCSKGYFQKFKFDDHVRTHSKERPHKCDECGKCFTTKNNLSKHQHIHGDARAFPCQLCDKGFARLTYLNAHMISHTKEKKHPCQFCGVRFGRSDHRRRHEYTAHQKP